MRVLLVDPGPQVPDYGRSLAGALAAAGETVTWVTGPLLYDALGPPPPGVAWQGAFGRLLGGTARQRALAARPWARRVLRAAGYPGEWAALRRCIEPDAPGVLHLQWSLVPPLDGAVLRGLGRRGWVTVLTAHNVLPHEPRPWHTASWRHLYGAVDRVVVHSTSTADRLLALGGIDRAAVQVIPMASDAPSDAVDRPAARAALQPPLDAAARVVLFFGHIRPYKGLDVLLDAMARTARSLPAARLVVAGAVLGGGAAERRVREAVAARGLAGRTDLHLGYVPRTRVGLYLAAADVVALPYRDVYDSAVLSTARGHGRAVVATAAGGLPEALGAGGGLVVPVGDAEALAVALGRVLHEPGLQQRLEAEATAAARAWTWADVAAATRGMYAAAGAERRGADSIGKRRTRPQPPPRFGGLGASCAPSAAPPLVTVILPVRNEVDHIGSVLAALLAGDHPPDRLEVLVVDGGSGDGTRALVTALAARDGRVRLVDNPRGSAAAGLNRGLAAASGQVIVRLDGHSEPATDYVSACVAALRRTGAGSVGGLMVGRGETAFGRAVAVAMGTPLGAGDARFRLGGEGPVDTVYLGAWWREVFDRVGRFDEGLPRNQDYEMCLRIRRAGGVVWLDPAIRTVTTTRPTPRALARQYFAYGAGRAATWQRHPDSLRPRQAIPAAFLATLAGLMLASPVSARARRGLAVLAAAYLAAVGAGTAAACCPPEIRRRLPLVYATMHLSWGAGFWWGLARAIRARRGV